MSNSHIWLKQSIWATLSGWNAETVVNKAIALYEEWANTNEFVQKQPTANAGLTADLPLDVFPVSNFLAAQIYTYGNKRTGKPVHHSIGLGKWYMAMVGRNIQIDYRGKPVISPPEFVFRLTLGECKESIESMPHLLKAMDLGNSFNWDAERIVDEAKALHEVWKTNRNSVVSANTNRTEMHPTALNCRSPVYNPTLTELNSPASPEPSDLIEQPMVGNSGYRSPLYNNIPWEGYGQQY